MSTMECLWAVLPVLVFASFSHQGLAHFLPEQNVADVYEISEDKDSNSVRLVHPRARAATARDIVYYHVVEKPNQRIADEDSESNEDVLQNLLSSGEGPEFDASRRGHTNAHGLQFFDHGEDIRALAARNQLFGSPERLLERYNKVKLLLPKITFEKPEDSDVKAVSRQRRSLPEEFGSDESYPAVMSPAYDDPTYVRDIPEAPQIPSIRYDLLPDDVKELITRGDSPAGTGHGGAVGDETPDGTYGVDLQSGSGRVWNNVPQAQSTVDFPKDSQPDIRNSYPSIASEDHSENDNTHNAAKTEPAETNGTPEIENGGETISGEPHTYGMDLNSGHGHVWNNLPATPITVLYNPEEANHEEPNPELSSEPAEGSSEMDSSSQAQPVLPNEESEPDDEIVSETGENVAHNEPQVPAEPELASNVTPNPAVPEMDFRTIPPAISGNYPDEQSFVPNPENQSNTELEEPIAEVPSSDETESEVIADAPIIPEAPILPPIGSQFTEKDSDVDESVAKEDESKGETGEGHPPGTYGMNLNGDHGHVWNDMSGVEYDVGQPNAASEDHHEGSHELAEPISQDNANTENADTFSVAPEPNTEDFEDIYVNKTNKPETNKDDEVIQHESEEIDVNEEDANNEGTIEEDVNKDDLNKEATHEEDLNKEVINEDDVNKEVINKENEDEEGANKEDIDIENDKKEGVNAEDANKEGVVEDSANKEDLNEDNFNKKDGSVENINEDHEGSENTGGNEDAFDEIRRDEKHGFDKKDLDSDDLLKWLEEWSSTYMEDLTKKIKEMVKEEVSLQLMEQKKEISRTNEDLNHAAEDNQGQSSGSVYINGEEIPITDDHLNAPVTDADVESLLRRGNKRPHEHNKEKDPQINVDSQTIYGNSVGNDRVTNMFFFYPEMNKDELLDHLKPIFGENKNPNKEFVVDERHEGLEIEAVENSPKPMVDSTTEPSIGPINEPVEESSVSEPVDEPINKPVNEPIIEPINQETALPVAEPVAEQTNEAANEPMAADKPILEPANQSQDISGGNTTAEGLRSAATIDKEPTELNRGDQ